MTPSKVEELIKSILKNNFKDEISLLSLTIPPSHIDFDASTNFGIIVSKKNKKDINEIYSNISNKLKEYNFDTSLLSGFINIRFDKTIYEQYIKEILNKEHLFKKENLPKVIIEFVSANPTGPLHIASAIGASIGDILSNIMKELGYNVFKEYYVNNCGNQVELLGKSVLARYSNKPIPEEGYHGQYIIDICKKLPPEAKQWAENNDIEKFSNFAIDTIITEQKEVLSEFGLIFDRWFFESELHREKLPQKVLDILKSKNEIEEKDGALWLKSDDKQDKERVLVKSNGAKTYFLNDLAYHLTKYERGFQWIIDIWGADHHGYIPRMKNGIRKLGYDEKKFTVIIHQLVSIKKGNDLVKMSKRQGTFYTLKELITETSKDAIRFFFTQRSPNTHIIFDIELAKKKSNENPLYYIQYAHARISSIIENAKTKNIETNGFYSYNLTNDDKKILRKIFWFEKTLYQCIKDLSPHHLTTYLIELAGDFHSYYEKHRIIDEENLTNTRARLFILYGIKATIKKGLDLLGVSAPEKM